LKIIKGCKQCGDCVDVCCFEAIDIKKIDKHNEYVINNKKCVSCREYIKVCGKDCIIDDVEV